MMGPSHQLFAAVSWAGYAMWAGGGHPSLAQVTVGAVVATAVSDGVLSPDMDQRRGFELARDVLGPFSRLLAHRRGITHWWVIPVALWVWWLPLLDPDLKWAATALVIGWASHLVGDAIFGRIPLLPGWGPMYGAGLKTDGWVEKGPHWFPVSPLRLALAAVLAVLLWSVAYPA